MHPSRHVFLINDSCRAIEVQYDPEYATGSQTYKTLNPDIKKDDIVVVPTNTRAGFTCVKVVGVDVNINIQSESLIEWIVDKVDIESHEKLVADEKDASDTIQKAKLKSEREKLREELLADTMDDVKTLSITNLSGSDKKD